MKRNATWYLALLSAVLLVIGAVAYAVNATAVSNFVSTVPVCLVAAAACLAVFALVGAKWADLGNLVAVPLTAAALAQLLISSINTIADVTSGITMFGSQGGIEWIVAVTAVMVVAMLLQIVSCFLARKPKAA